MSKSVKLSDMRRVCRVYPGDTDGFRVSQHRLEEFISNRDKAILDELVVVKAKLKENGQLIRALKRGKS